MKKNHVGAFAAQSAYFLMLSMIPIFLLLLTVIQFTPITKADVISAMMLVFPEEHVKAFIVSMVNQAYAQSLVIIPISALTALWSAGKGVVAINRGLNCVYGTKETRNFFLVRVRASFYTIVFIMVIVAGLIFVVFGNNLSIFVSKKFPFLRELIAVILASRTIVGFLLWFVFALLVYYVLSDRRYKVSSHIPGALFTSLAWMLMSFGFSTYLTFFKGFTGLYGSMSAIVLVMLWLYFCMYVMLIGGALNNLIVTKYQNKY